MIKSIDTKYKGYNFRSRLEARWAIYFDSLKIKWEYEKEGFTLEDETGRYNYLPDFWFPELRMFAEVKPIKFMYEEQKKAELLVKETGYPLIKLIGIPERIPYMMINFDDEKNNISVNVALSNYHNYPQSENRFYSSFDDSEIKEEWFDDIDKHIEKAKSKRFEFKEVEKDESI